MAKARFPEVDLQRRCVPEGSHDQVSIMIKSGHPLRTIASPPSVVPIYCPVNKSIQLALLVRNPIIAPAASTAINAIPLIRSTLPWASLS